MSHVSYEWVMSRMNETCLIWMSHVTYEWVMSHMNQSCHTRMSHVTYTRIVLYDMTCHSFEWVMSRTHELRRVTYLHQRVMPCSVHMRYEAWFWRVLCAYVVAVCCSVLQCVQWKSAEALTGLCTAVYRSVWQCIAVCCTGYTQVYIAMYDSTLQCITYLCVSWVTGVYCNVWQHIAVYYISVCILCDRCVPQCMTVYCSVLHTCVWQVINRGISQCMVVYCVSQCIIVYLHLCDMQYTIKHCDIPLHYHVW